MPFESRYKSAGLAKAATSPLSMTKIRSYPITVFNLNEEECVQSNGLKTFEKKIYR